MNRIATTCLSIFLSASCWAAGITPDFEHCTLQVGGTSLKPVQVVDRYQTVHKAGAASYLLSNATITKPKSDADAGWTVESVDGRRLLWMSASPSIAYFLGYRLNAEGRFDGYDDPPRVRRLDLKTGKWLADLTIAALEDEKLVAKGILDALALEDSVIVLVSLAKKGAKDDDEAGPAAYQVVDIHSDGGQPRWSRTFPAASERPYTGGYVWGIPPPEYAYSDLRHLSLLDDQLLVCAEAMQPIRCLTKDTGRDLWQVERLWEFQRGFIGPSVWSHFIDRFGVEEFGAVDKKALKEDFDKHYACALLAGPVAMPITFERGNDTHSIFVAVTKGPAKGYSGYLSECIVYELNNSGKPISMVTLPQMIDGSAAGITKDGIVWHCRSDTFVKMAPSLRAPVVMMGGGGADGLSRVTWLRQVSFHEPDAWLRTGKAGDPVTFGETHAFWIPSGGYIHKKEDRAYRFPIEAIDLQEGKQTDMLLDVPFKGDIRLPDTNISTDKLPDGTEMHETRLFVELAVTAMNAQEGFLDITLGAEHSATTLRFNLREAVELQVAVPASPDPMAAARIRAANIKKEDRNEALQKACGETDIAFVKALLEAGADPKYRSKVGWSALMVAACYGTAEMVEVLIKAGSDVNICDKNCGGQTVLMWASRGLRENNKKVKLLLDAGADPNSGSEDGYTPLMSAAQTGDVSAVETLLKAGAKISAKNKTGQTAIDLAKQSHQSTAKTVVEILEAAEKKKAP